MKRRLRKIIDDDADDAAVGLADDPRCIVWFSARDIKKLGLRVGSFVRVAAEKHKKKVFALIDATLGVEEDSKPSVYINNLLAHNLGLNDAGK